MHWIRIALLTVSISELAPGTQVVTIISPDGPLPRVKAADGKVHRDAAADLCDYLSRVSGRDIKAGEDATGSAVTIHVGPDAFVLERAPEVKSLYADGFVIKHIPVQGKHHFILAGIRDKSSRWAVEEFLKQFCGVRWLFPYDTVYGEIVPTRPTITVVSELNQKHEPDYMERSNLAMYFFDKNQAHLRLRASAGRSFGSHSFQFIFRRGDYEAHPEWFALFSIPDNWASSIASGSYAASESVKDALSQGIRRQRWHWDYGSGWQICTSNPETVQHAVKYARDYFSRNPEETIVSMGHNDNRGWCECPDCTAFANSVGTPYTVSERYWYWVNQVAKELAETHPGKQIATIAYGAPASPPRFPLEKNITVMVTVYMKRHLDLVKQWQQKCYSVNLYSYSYGVFFVGFRHYPHAMRDFLKWGHDELGAVAHVSECSGNWSFDGPKYHYMQALMWDVNADPDQIMQDYCRDWFGAAAGPMKVFWDRHESIYERRGPDRRLLFYQWLGFSAKYDEFDHYTLDDVRFLDASIAEAERTADTEADRFRVARVADAWTYSRSLLLGTLKFCDQPEKVLADAASSSVRALELAGELAELQIQKRSHLRQLRAYPHINPHIAKDAYYSTYSRISIFSDMRTILDALCEQVTRSLGQTNGQEEVAAFWRQIKRDNALHESAQTQLYMINHPARPNVLINGDFETGSLSGWQVSGDIAATESERRNGRFAAEGKGTLSQTVPVEPGQRYRLTAWGKYPTKPESGAILFGLDVSFQGGGKKIYSETTYRRLRTENPASGWMALQATFSVALNADTAVITLNPTRSSGISVLWDDLTLEKIQEGPEVESGVLIDDFSRTVLDDSKWVESLGGRSGSLPVVSSGQLVFGDGPSTTLVSLSSFDDLLVSTGDLRYRLRLRIANSGNKDGMSSFECGIKTGNMPISYREYRNGQPYNTLFHDSGLSFSHIFFPFNAYGKADRDILRTYWHQDTREVGGGNFDIQPKGRTWYMFDREVWYTFYFDPQAVTIYAGTRGGYDEKAEALVSRYEHNMTNITSKGPIFLKLSGTNIKVGEISLMRPGSVTGYSPPNQIGHENSLSLHPLHQALSRSQGDRVCIYK